jgi:Flp pilus assembly pilin Flp
MREWIGSLADESGQGLVEYVMILSLVSILLVAALTGFSGAVQVLFDSAIPWPG